MAGSQIRLWPDWKIIRELGAGSFGKVYEIHRQNGVHLEKAALKVIRVPSSPADLMQLRSEGLQAERTEEYLARHVDEIRNEIGVMQKFVGYSNIVSYEDYLIDKHPNDIGWDILIRMELLTALSDYMTTKLMTEKLVLKMGMDIAQALVILHGSGIIHRDIKPQNIFINDRGFFKLGDFGISRAMPQSGGVMSFKGSVAYMAPETFAMRGSDSRSDIYSLALVIYRCLNGGREPFLKNGNFTPAQKEEAQHIRLAGTRLPAPAYASKSVADVLSIALDPNPAGRYQTAAHFYQALAYAAANLQNDRVPLPQQSSGKGRSRTGGSGSSEKSARSRKSGAYSPNYSGTGINKPNSDQQRGATDGSVSVRRGTYPPMQGGSGTGTGRNSSAATGFSLNRKVLLAAAAAAIALLLGSATWMTLGTGTSGQSYDQNAISASDIKSNLSDDREVITRTGTIQYDGEDAGNAVVFADSALEAAVRKELGMEERTITVADAVNVFELDLSGDVKSENEKIKDLTGLSCFENLQELNLSGNLITNLDELEGMYNLEHLNLGGNRITDLTPLKNLNSLWYLDLIDNEIDSIAPITGLTDIFLLDVSGNILTSLEGIQGFSDLEVLMVGRNELSDLRPISSLTNITWLDASENRIERIDALENLTNLEALSLEDNQIEDIRPLKKMDGLEYLLLHNNQISDISPILNLPNLQQVTVFGNPLDDPESIEKFSDYVNVYTE